MEKTLVTNGKQISTARQIGRKIAMIAISPFYRRIEEKKTSHCAVSFMVDSKGKTKGVAAGAGVYAEEIKGVAAGIVGSFTVKCDGVNVAVGMTMTDNMRGFSASMVNHIGETNSGVALGFLGASVGSEIGTWTIGDYCSKGAVIGGLYARTHENTKGFVFGGIITMLGNMRGITAGLINIADSFEGFRLGLVNMTLDEAPSRGLEIGLLNIRLENPWWAKVSPLFAIRGLTRRIKQEE